MKEDLVEYQLVAQLYEALLEQCHDLGLVPPGVKRGELVIYYQTELGNQANFHQLFVLPNGALFLSEVSACILTHHVFSHSLPKCWRPEAWRP
jgi:hypothetical protein